MSDDQHVPTASQVIIMKKKTVILSETSMEMFFQEHVQIKWTIQKIFPCSMMMEQENNVLIFVWL